MELKETNHLLSSVDKNEVKPLERNNSDRESIYDMFFSAKERMKSIIALIVNMLITITKNENLATFPLWIGFKPGDQQK